MTGEGDASVGSVRLAIKAVPGARQDQIAGWLGEPDDADRRLKVRITAPPEGGRANRAICALIASTLGIKPRHVSVVAGRSSPEKIVAISGVSEEVLQRLTQ